MAIPKGSPWELRVAATVLATTGSSSSRSDEDGGPTSHFASGLDEAENGQNETLISRGETKRFAWHVVSHWNH
jgi:hypothetical protein